MVSELREELRNKKMKLLLSGFGVGLSWGSVILSTDKIIVPELIEYQ
jgi:3-oxoacyl-[acyl-carrier-protein] synthase-3